MFPTCYYTGRWHVRSFIRWRDSKRTRGQYPRGCHWAMRFRASAAFHGTFPSRMRRPCASCAISATAGAAASGFPTLARQPTRCDSTLRARAAASYACNMFLKGTAGPVNTAFSSTRRPSAAFPRGPMTSCSAAKLPHSWKAMPAGALVDGAGEGPVRTRVGF